MNKSLDYAQAHPDEVRGVLTEYTEIPPEAAQKINLPQWKSELTTDTIEQLSSLSKKYGLHRGGARPQRADPEVS